ncbi:MAG: hypothetical protein AAGC68_08900, partial [Verrucomicrobiota bacterium]
MHELLQQLEANPTDWTLRCSIIEQYYQDGAYEIASNLVTSAPEIPGDEGNIVFAATVLGAHHPSTGISLLDQFEASHGPSDSITELRMRLNEMIAAPQEVADPAASEADTPIPRKLTADDEVAPATTDASEPDSSGEGKLAEAPTLTAPEPGSFVIGEGQVHAAERESDTKEKVGAVVIAALIHLVIGIGLGLWALTTPPPAPPQISVSSLAQTDDSSLENATMQKMQQKKTTATVATTQPVISSTAFSSFAIPENFDTATDVTMLSMASSDTGFGMSMSGFGDVSNMSAIPAGMRSRCSMSQRMKLLRESGGEDRAERAVRDGLEYLTKQQNKQTGAFGVEYTAGMTGLALLAYLGHCETPESPKFGDSVVSAALYLMDRCLKNDGIITNGQRGHHEAYEHAIATYALAELYTMTKESGKEIPRLESVLRKAVGVIVDAQHSDGGWPYGFDGKGKEDMSVSGWQVQALKAAYNTGRNFPGVTRALDDALEDYI